MPLRTDGEEAHPRILQRGAAPGQLSPPSAETPTAGNAGRSLTKKNPVIWRQKRRLARCIPKWTYKEEKRHDKATDSLRRTQRPVAHADGPDGRAGPRLGCVRPQQPARRSQRTAGGPAGGAGVGR